jgi:hypothetical protein
MQADPLTENMVFTSLGPVFELDLAAVSGACQRRCAVVRREIRAALSYV